MAAGGPRTEDRPARAPTTGRGRVNKSWQPFGGGRRYCVGAQLAMLEMRVIIREVLRRVELAAVNPAPERQRISHVTLVPGKRTRVIARARRDVPAPVSG